MPKRAISLTLEEANLLWLRAQTLMTGARSLSDTVDRLIGHVRTIGIGGQRALRSVAATIDLDATDPQLASARGAVRVLFQESLARPLVVMEPTPPFTAPTMGRARKRRG